MNWGFNESDQTQRLPSSNKKNGNGKSSVYRILQNPTYIWWMEEILHQLIGGKHPIIYTVTTFKYTDLNIRTGISYYLRGLAVWPALHIFKSRYRRVSTIRLRWCRISQPSTVWCSHFKAHWWPGFLTDFQPRLIAGNEPLLIIKNHYYQYGRTMYIYIVV